MPPLSAVVTSNALVSASPARVVAVVLNGGSDTSTLTLKNAITNTGTALLSTFSTVADQSTPLKCYRYPFSVGVYAVLTGTAASATVFYEPI
jgi:hypothetical protein